MPIAESDIGDLFPAPFPDDVPIIDLPRISLDKLLKEDAEELHKVLEICKQTGFFYLHMTDHEMGLKMYEEACQACRIGMQTLPNLSMEEKNKYPIRNRHGVFDRGFRCRYLREDGQPKYSEFVNIPQTELFSKEPCDFELPPWLKPHEDAFKSAMTSANVVANVILGVLERGLQLPTGSLTSLHSLDQPSSDFLRVLRYPGVVPGQTTDQMGFPAHKDAVSVAILFTWLGGLQILEPGMDPTEENWRWVKPLPGYAILNLGDAMEIFSNGVLKSGLHRVVKAPGEQAPYDKYSVLMVARPADTTPMTAFTSPVIPPLSEAQKNEPVLTSDLWASKAIRSLQDPAKARELAAASS